ncbi:MAG: tRNA guanosine(34) transglycosylase Tgt [Patescibacteria group bacterium]|nr:tRNA guanosine(34) transglycosylase Tgt [Patescibacteria group bacterium]MDE1944177.1 tRNA guanosine(34) transglycosylase Tgt [Patescibacteria group bacterium]MDE1945079.1 tRNA guanosine(34) transglycosylase Tgt [Patescibacteria group bacterium]MDE2057944.1 tRNA guanosine(34) transglycosylase Tgt [Patescibacteria group bacterium]
MDTRAASARAGVLHTPHGDIKTPAFAPVGTRGSVKGVSPAQLQGAGAEVVLANTYHLYLSPGQELVKEAGGLAQFMGWEGPTITDSGGFQVFSLGAAYGKKISKFTVGGPTSRMGEVEEKEDQVAVYDPEVASQHGQLAIIDDEGVSFTSHVDGSLHRFTPERSVEIQHALGADIFFAFDECTAPTEPYDYQKEAMERTHRWAERSLRAHRQNIDAASRQAIFGIAQGGQFDDLRRASAKAIGSMGFDGFGLGGSFSKKYGDDSLESALKMLAEIPPEMPVHGLGVGEPGDILLSVKHGVDIFDCVAPTRIGRHGSVYTKRGIIHLKGEQYRSDFSPIDPETVAPGTQGFTRAYVSHLVRSGEMLGSIICSLHNLHFILALVAGAREAILAGRFDAYREDFVRAYYQT